MYSLARPFFDVDDSTLISMYFIRRSIRTHSRSPIVKALASFPGVLKSDGEEEEERAATVYK